MEHVMAFDVSMGKSTMVIYNRDRKCQFEGEIEHNQLAFQKLQETVEELKKESKVIPSFVFEATGVYSAQLERFFKENGYAYSKLNPLEAKMQMASMRRQKTDKNDAHQLAKTHFTMERRTTFPQERYYEQMRALSRYYEEVEEEIHILQSRLHSVIQLSFPELEKLFSTRSALYLNIVQLFPHPDLIKDLSKTVVRNRLRANTRKNISPQRAETKALVLIEAANLSYPAIDCEDIRCDQAKDYANRLAALVEKKDEIVQKMVQLSLERKEYRILKSIPGIGDTTAVRLIAEIGDITRFNNHKQLNAYAGIDIRRYQSGTFAFKDKINKRGNNKLRKILYFMVQTMITLRRFGGNHFVDYYDKLKTQPQGKCHKVASIACVNKFLKVTFHLITHNLTYNYEMASKLS